MKMNLRSSFTLRLQSIRLSQGLIKTNRPRMGKSGGQTWLVISASIVAEEM